jgi:hypothetical protein
MPKDKKKVNIPMYTCDSLSLLNLICIRITQRYILFALKAGALILFVQGTCLKIQHFSWDERVCGIMLSEQRKECNSRSNGITE